MADKRVAYDPALIQEFADHLYEQANAIILRSTISGLFVGLLGGIVIGGILQFTIDKYQQTAGSQPPSLLVGGVIAIIVTFLGAWSGQARGIKAASKLKLDAQIALCQMQIEKNTAGAHAPNNESIQLVASQQPDPLEPAAEP